MCKSGFLVDIHLNIVFFISRNMKMTDMIGTAGNVIEKVKLLYVLNVQEFSTKDALVSLP